MHETEVDMLKEIQPRNLNTLKSVSCDSERGCAASLTTLVRLAAQPCDACACDNKKAALCAAKDIHAR